MVAHRGGKINAWRLGHIGRDPLRISVSDFIGKDCTSHVSFNRSRGHHPDPPMCWISLVTKFILVS